MVFYLFFIFCLKLVWYAPCRSPAIDKISPHSSFRWISTVGLHVDVVSSSLCVTATVLTINRKSFSTGEIPLVEVKGEFSCLSNDLLKTRDSLLSEQKRIISCQIVEWLKNVSLHQGANPYSRGLFKKDGNEDFVVEMDGTPAKGSFTVLCVGGMCNIAF